MQGLIAKILWSMAARMMTEALLSKVLVCSLWKLSQETTNSLDDKIVLAVAEALSVKDYK